MADTELVKLLAKALGVAPDKDGVLPLFDVLEAAMTTLGIKVVLPSNAMGVDLGDFPLDLRPGDHVIVRSAHSNEVFHHGIYIGLCTLPGQTKEGYYVVDMYGEPHEGKQGATLRLRPMGRFLKTKGRPELAVLKYDNDTPEMRARTAGVALLLQDELRDVQGLYRLLDGNCGHFATFCRTMRWKSPEMRQIISQVEEVVANLMLFSANAVAGAISSATSSF